jgi:hypothetical protein
MALFSDAIFLAEITVVGRTKRKRGRGFVETSVLVAGVAGLKPLDITLKNPSANLLRVLSVMSQFTPAGPGPWPVAFLVAAVIPPSNFANQLIRLMNIRGGGHGICIRTSHKRSGRICNQSA